MLVGLQGPEIEALGGELAHLRELAGIGLAALQRALEIGELQREQDMAHALAPRRLARQNRVEALADLSKLKGEGSNGALASVRLARQGGELTAQAPGEIRHPLVQLASGLRIAGAGGREALETALQPGECLVDAGDVRPHRLDLDPEALARGLQGLHRLARDAARADARLQGREVVRIALGERFLQRRDLGIERRLEIVDATGELRHLGDAPAAPLLGHCGEGGEGLLQLRHAGGELRVRLCLRALGELALQGRRPVREGLLARLEAGERRAGRFRLLQPSGQPVETGAERLEALQGLAAGAPFLERRFESGDPRLEHARLLASLAEAQNGARPDEADQRADDAGDEGHEKGARGQAGAGLAGDRARLCSRPDGSACRRGTGGLLRPGRLGRRTLDLRLGGTGGLVLLRPVRLLRLARLCSRFDLFSLLGLGAGGGGGRAGRRGLRALGRARAGLGALSRSDARRRVDIPGLDLFRAQLDGRGGAPLVAPRPARAGRSLAGTALLLCHEGGLAGFSGHFRPHFVDGCVLEPIAMANLGQVCSLEVNECKQFFHARRGRNAPLFRRERGQRIGHGP